MTTLLDLLCGFCLGVGFMLLIGIYIYDPMHEPLPCYLSDGMVPCDAKD